MQTASGGLKRAQAGCLVALWRRRMRAALSSLPPLLLQLRRGMHAMRTQALPTRRSPCSYMEGGRIAFSGSPDEMRAYMRRLGALV